jgi:hypothetical protein
VTCSTSLKAIANSLAVCIAEWSGVKAGRVSALALTPTLTPQGEGLLIEA